MASRLLVSSLRAAGASPEREYTLPDSYSPPPRSRRCPECPQHVRLFLNQLSVF